MWYIEKEVIISAGHHLSGYAGNQKYNAGVLRGNLQSRSMAAISKKYWEIMGSEHKKKIDINQRLFDFAQDKLG